MSDVLALLRALTARPGRFEHLLPEEEGIPGFFQAPLNNFTVSEP